MKTALPSTSFEAIIFAAIIAILLVIRAIKKRKRTQSWDSSAHYSKPDYRKRAIDFDLELDEPKLADIQLVLNATFQKKRLMNFEEYGLFKQLEKLLMRNTQGLRLFSQVSLGEIIEPPDRESPNRAAFFKINDKRCDFVIIDRFGYALVVIEYHGSGHFQRNFSHRDEVKRLALRKASIPTVEVLFDYEWNDVESELKKELGEVFSPS